MQHQLSIGSAQHNQIIVKDSVAHPVQAQINYAQGKWILSNSTTETDIYINDTLLKTTHELQKYDKIKIGQQIIHWQDYLYEGDAQELNFVDFKSFHGRISRSNYRALSLLFLGLTISVFFLPGLLGSIYIKLIGTNLGELEFIQMIAPYIYTIGYLILGIVFLIISLKRIRDTGQALWKIVLPVYNLKLLYFEKSKK